MSRITPETQLSLLAVVVPVLIALGAFLLWWL
jgi:hypothetical protein